MKYIFTFLFFILLTGQIYSQSVNDLLLGVSYMLPTKSFEIVKNSGNSKYNLYWMYISLTFKPQLLGLNFK